MAHRFRPRLSRAHRHKSIRWCPGSSQRRSAPSDSGITVCRVVYGCGSFDNYGHPGGTCFSQAVVGCTLVASPNTSTGPLTSGVCVQALSQVLPFVRNPSAILLFVPGHSKYHAIAAALLGPWLIARLTAKRMESCAAHHARFDRHAHSRSSQHRIIPAVRCAWL